jgi:hypothetical protein
VLDTTALTGPDGLRLDSASHLDQVFDLAILRGNVNTFRGAVTVRGTRALVVLGRTIIVEGLLDAAAVGSTPGPGGALSGQGDGAGKRGNSNSNTHGGGSGGGYGSEVRVEARTLGAAAAWWLVRWQAACSVIAATPKRVVAAAVRAGSFSAGR